MASQLITLAQVFGGCCTNVFVLDKMISKAALPPSNTSQSFANVITFSQFLFVAVASYACNRDTSKASSWKRLYLKSPQVPLKNWLVLVLMYFSISLCNNWSLSYHISVPTFIMFRLSGTVVTMAVGWLFGGKLYNRAQISSCLVISGGMLVSALPAGWYEIAASYASSTTSTARLPELDGTFLVGIALLTSTTLLLAVMGLYNETIYLKYGNQWRESLFYTHFLGLPLFLAVLPKIVGEFNVLWADRDVYDVFPLVSKQFIDLCLNVVSQYVCIRGVNALAGSTSAVSVIIILLIRKFISFFFSILWFGHEFTLTGAVGGTMVLVGAAMYSFSGSRARVRRGKNNRSYVSLKKMGDDGKKKWPGSPKKSS